MRLAMKAKQSRSSRTAISPLDHSAPQARLKARRSSVASFHLEKKMETGQCKCLAYSTETLLNRSNSYTRTLTLEHLSLMKWKRTAALPLLPHRKKRIGLEFVQVPRGMLTTFPREMCASSCKRLVMIASVHGVLIRTLCISHQEITLGASMSFA